MSKFSQKIETLANICVIVVAVVLVGVVVHKYFIAKPNSAQPARVQPIVGKIVNLPNEDWSKQQKTIVLALQTTCRYCNESAPFYKRLVEETRGKNIKIIAVLPQNVEESQAHLKELGVNGIEIKQAAISTLDASGTPTLILTDKDGKITNFWVGKLSPAKENEVINQINS